MEDSKVNTKYGALQGKTGTNIDGKLFHSFQGIPYAKPPIGNLRFKAPQPPDSWPGVRAATAEGHQCVSRHIVLRNISGSEDCLTLNVFTPKLPQSGGSGTIKPVMVWIHGGGFTSGSSSTDVYGPEYLMTEDIVLVTINYRTGVLGFLSLEDPTLGVPGNAGLKDMVMALRWVRDNIGHFGGDPGNVTIFGESAGGAAAHYLILSPMAKGLFHKAILQSGCALCGWAIGSRRALEMGRVLGLQTSDEREVFKVLRELPADKLYRTGEKLADEFVASVVRPFGPVIEKRSSEAFIFEEPVDILKSGNYNHVPMIIGFTTREGMLSEILQQPKPFKPMTDFELAVPNFLKLQRGSELSQMIAREIKKFYYGTEEPTDLNRDAYYLMETDNFFLREIIRTVRGHVETSPKPIYFYRMSIESELNLLKHVHQIEGPGVSHGDDLGYLFKNMIAPDLESGSTEDIAVRRFVKLWTNFARSGNPNPKTKDSLITVEWKAVDRKAIHFLDIGKELVLDVDPEAERIEFWDKLLKINHVHKL